MYIKITSHARERWVQRIVDPNVYKHIDECKEFSSGCRECCSLYTQIRNCVNLCYRGINSEIARSIHLSNEVVDPVFLKTMENYDNERGRNNENKKYYRNRNAVFVVVYGEPHNTLISVLNADMIDGSVIKFSNNHKENFHSWKFKAKLNSFYKQL